MFGSSRSIALKLMAMLAVATAWAGALAPAHAGIEVRCIEASRYKYLYLIFDNNPAKAAAFFAIDQNHLPSPETCRAVLVTGPIEMPPHGGESDFDRLLDAVQAGNGWLATFYLASPGGAVEMGLHMGELTRMFWVNTHAIDGPAFDYVPDFIVSAPDGSGAKIPPDLQRGWQNYVAATQSLLHVTYDKKRHRCASACTFTYTAGIDRQGVAWFHRGHGTKDNAPMTDILANLSRMEDVIVAFYRQMDAGDAAIEAYKSTTSATVAPETAAPYPRYVDDYLNKACGSLKQRAPASASGGSKRRSERTPGLPAPAEDQALGPAAPSAGGQPNGGAAQDAGEVDFAAIQCRVAANTKERLTQFAKVCGSGCNHAALYQEAGERFHRLVPPKDERAGKPEDPRRSSRGNH